MKKISLFLLIILLVLLSCNKHRNINNLSATQNTMPNDVITDANVTSRTESAVTTTITTCSVAIADSATTIASSQTTLVNTSTAIQGNITTESCNYESEENVEFDSFYNYTEWAEKIGYPSGLLCADGSSGLNQDYFHTPIDTESYNSGRIVIGDSRCCQLGIYQSRMNSSDFAVFAVWGGHYVSGYGGIMTDEHFEEVEKCFCEQIKNRGKSEIYLFATINDYDYRNNANSSYISSVVSTAENLASMSCELNGTVYHPEVILIGFNGSKKDGYLFGIPNEIFNQYIEDYNNNLFSSVAESTYLNGNIDKFSTISKIVAGQESFIDDGLHYSDSTLKSICSYIQINE